MATTVGFIQIGELSILLYSARLLLYTAFAYSVWYFLTIKTLTAPYLRFQIASVGFISLFLGFLQYIFLPDTRFLAIFGWDDHYYRLIGSFFDPAFTGIIFLITSTIALSTTFLKHPGLRLAAILIAGVGILLTFSRASYLATLVTASIAVFLHLPQKKYALGCISAGLFLGVLGLFLAPKPGGEGVHIFRTASISARSTALKSQLSQVTPATFILGNGLFSPRSVVTPPTITYIPSQSRVPDNLAIQVFLSFGIPGTVLFLMVVRACLRWAYQKNSLLFALYIGVLVHSQFSNTLLQPFVLLLLLMSTVTYGLEDAKTTVRNDT